MGWNNSWTFVKDGVKCISDDEVFVPNINIFMKYFTCLDKAHNTFGYMFYAYDWHLLDTCLVHFPLKQYLKGSELPNEILEKSDLTPKRNLLDTWQKSQYCVKAVIAFVCTTCKKETSFVCTIAVETFGLHYCNWQLFMHY